MIIILIFFYLILIDPKQWTFEKSIKYGQAWVTLWSAECQSQIYLFSG